MAEAGCGYAVMEVSSHAVSLERIGGIRFAAAAFTNLTEDHLDFHKTMDAYCDAKAELFRRCDRAVVNMDDSYAGRILDACGCPVLTTSVTGPGDLTAKDVSLHAEGISFTAVTKEEQVPVKLGIPGRFTVYNALTVLGLGVSLGISLKDCAAALLDVRVSCLDISSVTDSLQKIAPGLMAKKAAQITDENKVYDEARNYREDFLAEVMAESAAQALEDTNQTMERTFTLQLVRSEGAWQVIPTEELLQFLSGFVSG